MDLRRVRSEDVNEGCFLYNAKQKGKIEDVCLMLLLENHGRVERTFWMVEKYDVL
jgi:hypothetical protein